MHAGAFKSVSQTDHFVRTRISPARSPRKREFKALEKAATALHHEEERHKSPLDLTPCAKNFNREEEIQE